MSSTNPVAPQMNPYPNDVPDMTVSNENNAEPEAVSNSSSSSATSKLVPAAPPTVSAWGAVASATKATTLGVNNSSKEPLSGKKEQQWPSAESILAKPLEPQQEVGTSKTKSSSVRVKQSGRERWIPFQAEIRIQTNSNTTRKKSAATNGNSNAQKKKSNSGGSTNAIPNATNSNQKPKSSTQQNRKASSITVIEHTKEPKRQSVSDSVRPETVEPSKGLDRQPVPKFDISPQLPDVEALRLSSSRGNSGEYSINQFKMEKVHRHSETSLYSNSIRGNSRRHHNKSYNHGNTHRNSVPNTTYGGAPFMFNNSLNYAYGSQFVNSYNQPFYGNPGTSFKPRSSRSNSHSPSTPDLGSSGMISHTSSTPISDGTPNFLPQNIPYTYIQDPITLVANQLSYYFSPDNLAKDVYLRKQMNSQGLVPLKKLIEFFRLKKLTGGDINMLYAALNYTPYLELIGDKVRVRDNWKIWILPSNDRDPAGKDD